MDLTFDDGVIPSVLAMLGAQQTLQLMADTAAETYHYEMREWIDAGKAFTPRTGHLDQLMGWRSAGQGESVIYAAC